VKADRQEQHHGQREAPGRGQPSLEPEQGAHAHRQFAERDEDAERDRDVGERRDQRVDRAAPGGARQLRLDRAGSVASKNLGLASFCSPAKQNVNPRKARSGSNTRPSWYGADDDGTGLDATRYPPGLRASQ
jgi:hypothetical protein